MYMKTDLNILKEIHVVRGDSFSVGTIIENDEGAPLDLTDFTVDVGFKLMSDIGKDDSYMITSLSSDNNEVLKDSQGKVYFFFNADKSIYLPITDTVNFIIVSIKVYSADLKYRKEYHYALYVHPNVFAQLY